MPITQSSRNEEIAGKIVKKWEILRSNRGNLDSHCREIAQRIWPGQSRMFGSFGKNVSTGEKRNEEIFDSTAASALNKFTSILDSLLTPMNQTWHYIIADNPLLMKDRGVALWMEELNRNIFRKRYAADANFVPQNQLVYKGLGAYGTSGLFTDDLRRRGRRVNGFRYRNVHLSELYLMENHQGIVENVYRYYKATADQIRDRFGSSMPERVSSKLDTAPQEEFYLLHCVMPRMNIDYERKDFMSMEWASYYVLEEGAWLLEEGGYESFPYGISRYEQDGISAYGRSPAMEALPAIMTLNEEKKTLLTQGHRAVAPPLFAYDDGVLDTYNITPGSVNWGGVSPDGKLLVHPMPVGNVLIGKDMMDDERVIINDLFLVPFFQMLQKNPQMTATEVMEKSKEKGILLAPTVGRQYNEYHGRVIEREIDLELRQNPEFAKRMPQVLIEAGGEYTLRYDSPMARMQRAEEAAGLMRNVDITIQIAQQTQNPAALDHWNWDVIIPELAEIGNVPKRWLNSIEQIQQIRSARAQQAQDQQDIQSAPAGAALLKARVAAAKEGVEVAESEAA
jgi:hypothetical protein